MPKHKISHNVIEQVPVDYYQEGIKKNILQRVWHTNKRDIVLSYIKKSPASVLDVGCASGWFLYEIHKKHPSAKCFGVDIYKKAIQYGKKRYPSLRLRTVDAHKLPYRAKTFDLVVCTEVLEHMHDPEMTLVEIKRVLKRRGEAIIELDSGSILFSVVWFLWRKSRGSIWNDSHLHSFTIKKLQKTLKKLGFVIKSQRRFNLGMAMVFVVTKE